MVPTFWKVDEEGEEEATETVHGPQRPKYLKLEKCFPAPDIKHLVGSRSSTKLEGGICE